MGFRLLISFVLLLNVLIPGLVSAEEAEIPHLLISEVQTGTETAASEEFVELYNPGNKIVDLVGFSLQYKSATGDGWLNKLEFEGKIQPRGHYLVSAKDYLEETEEEFSAGLAAGGGHVRLVKLPEDEDESGEEAAETEIIDLVGWGTADSAEGGNPTPAPDKGESITRLFNEEGEMIDTDDNAADFSLSEVPTPTSTPPPEDSNESLVEEPEEEEAVEEPEEELEEKTPVKQYLSLQVTEFLPDPVKPQTDSDDEFVELHNPHETAIDLKDYVIQTGANLQYRFVLPSFVLKPGEYKAFYSRRGNITLSNSGGRVQVVNPDGEVASKLVKYDKAPAGESYALLEGEFSWTNRVTPGVANQNRISQTAATGSSTSSTNTTSKQLRTNYPKLIITELLPDPASPQTDADDEFVEIYNPNTFSVQLEGYVLKTGGTLRTKYAFPAMTIKPGQYLAFFSGTTNISLANKGGGAQLEGENGTVIYTTKSYPKAVPGVAWALVEGIWGWTTVVTPAAVNVLTAVPEKDSSSEVLSAGSAATRQAALQSITAPATITASPHSAAIVAGAALLAVIYGGYEFRYDIRNRLRFIRRYFTAGRENRS